MKKLWMILLIVVVSFSLAACGGKTPAASETPAPASTDKPAETPAPAETPTPAPAKDPIKLVIWDWLNGDQNTGPGKYFKEMDDAFMKEYPYVTVEHVPQPSDKYYEILQTAFSANQGPDVFLMHAGSYDKKQSSLLKLNGLVDDVKDQLLGWEVQSEGGDPAKAMYGVPMGIQGVVWYYNKELFTKAGLDPNAPPKTWDDLLAAAEKLKVAGITPIFGGDKEGAFFSNWMMNNLFSNIMSEEDMKAFGAADLDYSKNAKLKETLIRMRELVDKGYYPKDGLSTPIYPDGGEKFIKGEAGMTLGLIADVLNWKEFGDKLGYDKVGMFPNPAPAGSPFPNVVNAAPGIAWSVYAQSKHQDEALLYAKFVTNAKNALRFYQLAGTIPNNKGVDLSVLDKEIIKNIADSVFKTPILPYNQYKSLIKAVMTAPIQEYTRGTTTIDEALARIQKDYVKDQALKK